MDEPNLLSGSGSAEFCALWAETGNVTIRLRQLGNLCTIGKATKNFLIKKFLHLWIGDTEMPTCRRTLTAFLHTEILRMFFRIQ